MLKQVRAVSMGLQTLNICDYFKKMNLLTGKCFRDALEILLDLLGPHCLFFFPPEGC